MTRPTVCKRPSDWLVRDLNMFLKTRFHVENPFAVTTQAYLACQPVGVDWVSMCALAAIRSNNFQDYAVDLFGTGNTGPVPEQLAAGVAAWAGVADIEMLKVHPSELASFDGLLAVYCAELEKRAAFRREASQPAPIPAPTPVEPPPVPAPSKPTPATWWNCPRCGEHNPPLRERCYQCRAFRPDLEPQTPTPAPAPEPAPAPQPAPAPVPAPKRTIPGWMLALSGLALGFAAGALDKLLDRVLFPATWDVWIKGLWTAITAKFGH